MKRISEALDQYTDICKEAIVDSAAKLSKRFEKVIIEVRDANKLDCAFNASFASLNVAKVIFN